MPDEEERHEAAEAVWPVGFAQKNVGAAGLRHCRAEFGPDAAVDERERGADDPGEDALRAVHGADDEGDDDEWADADHERHVEGGGFEEAEAAFEFFGFGHFVAMRCCKRTESIARKGCGAGVKSASAERLKRELSERSANKREIPRLRPAPSLRDGKKKRRGSPLEMTGVACVARLFCWLRGRACGENRR